ncbi:MAG: hypothetical protein JWP62_653 [Blastococcus sp.]|nr:hypothetical protein [Blastococcus sp.]
MGVDTVQNPPGDPAEHALEGLMTELDRCMDELTLARARAETLLRERRSGRTWTDIVSGEPRPLVVERISTVLASLATAGHFWRREQASALQGEQVSINRIAAMFGVTRQRISALLKERDNDRADPQVPPLDL